MKRGLIKEKICPTLPYSNPPRSPPFAGRPGPRVVAPKPSSSRSSAAGSGTGLSAYDAAYALYEKGECARAQQAFADFLAASPKSSLASNAVYWQGECQYLLGKYDGAIIFFQDVINRYPKHAKAAAALLKAGYSYELLKDMDNARFYWQILVDDFPKSAPAVLARKRRPVKLFFVSPFYRQCCPWPFLPTFPPWRRASSGPYWPCVMRKASARSEPDGS